MEGGKIVYIYDGSFEGMLDSVARAVKSEREVGGIACKSWYRPKVFETPIKLETDKAQARRLFRYLQKGAEGKAARFALNGYLSEESDAANQLCTLVQLCLVQGKTVVNNFSNPAVRFLEKLSRKVEFEAHRFSGLIRFRILKSGLQYAPFEPDSNIIGYCGAHFRQRLGGRSWILHDIRRNIAMYWNGIEFQDIEIDQDFHQYVWEHGEIPPSNLTSEEYHYQNQWKSFHCSISNVSRTNKKLQRQHMPRRYWKYLVEM